MTCQRRKLQAMQSDRRVRYEFHEYGQRSDTGSLRVHFNVTDIFISEKPNSIENATSKFSTENYWGFAFE